MRGQQVADAVRPSMKAVVRDTYATVDLSESRDVERPTLAGDEVLVRVRARPTGLSNKGETMTSPKRLARIAGVFYLLVGITGGFAEGFVDPTMYVAGDAAATAGNVVANSGLVRMAVVAHLVDAVFFVLTAMALYLLLNYVHKNAARVMVVLVILAAGIISLNAVFQFAGLRVATDGSYAAAFGGAGSNALVLLLLDIQHYGTLAAQVFFGLWLAPLGYLAFKSRLFPKALGVLLVVAAVSYLVDVFAAFLFPGVAEQIHMFLAIAPAISEVWMVMYLLVKGVKSSSTADMAAPAFVAAPVAV
jgi:hypothetical protein